SARLPSLIPQSRPNPRARTSHDITGIRRRGRRVASQFGPTGPVADDQEARRMSRRNTRQGKARRRAKRNGGQVTERERKHREISDQDPRAVEDRVVYEAPGPDGPVPRNPDEHGSGLRSEVDGGLIAVDPGEADLGTDAELENADPSDFSDLDPDD